MINRRLTIIINTFNSSDRIFSCLDSISSKYKVLVIENSNDIDFKKKLEKKYKNLKCYLTKQNLGYAKGNNFGLKLVKTKYALVLNPDTVLMKNSLKNFFIFTKKIKDFSIVGPRDKLNKKNSYEVDSIKGFAMFLNMKDFFKLGFFDENFFIYCEEIDLCRRVKKINKKIYIDPSIKINHIGGSSHNKNINFEMELSRNWHWMWSQFYYNKKYRGFLFSLLIFFPKLLTSGLKTVLYFILLKKIKSQIYFNRFLGLLNSIIGKKSFYRPRIVQ